VGPSGLLSPLLSACERDFFRVSQDPAAHGSCAERSERPPEYLLDRSRSYQLVSSLVSRRGYDQQTVLLVIAPRSCTPDACMRSVDSVGRAAP
jgi:hypothetical protein